MTLTQWPRWESGLKIVPHIREGKHLQQIIHPQGIYPAPKDELEEVVEVEEETMMTPILMIEEAETLTVKDKTGVTTVHLPGLHVHHPLLM